MPHIRPGLSRALIIAGFIAIAVAGCGRRGPLEPPPESGRAIDLPDDAIGATEQTPPSVTPLGRPSRNNRAIAVPERNFVLDPLL